MMAASGDGRWSDREVCRRAVPGEAHAMMTASEDGRWSDRKVCRRAVPGEAPLQIM